MKREKEESAAKRRTKEMLIRLNPKKASDFRVLFSELDIWRKTESEKIENSEVPIGEKNKLKKELLEDETKVIRKIESLQSDAKKFKRREMIKKNLIESSQNKKWKLSNGTVLEVQTPFTKRADELKKIYMNVSKEYDNNGEMSDL